MRVERVRYFEAAARLGSLRAAAHEMGISQQALGPQIQLLEEELDTVLLTRTRRGATPTAAGHALLASVQRLIRAEEQLHETAQGLRGEYEGVVRIGCVPVLATALVGPVVARLLKGHQGLSFTVVESSSRDIEGRVSDGQLDLGVITQPQSAPPPETARQSLFNVPLVACIPAAHPLARRDWLLWEDLKDQPLVSMRSGTTLWDALLRHIDDPHIVFEAASVSTLRLMVEHGAGLGVEARVDAVGPQDDSVVRLPLVGPDTTVPFCLTYSTRTQPSRAAVTVRNVILSEIERFGGS